MIDVDLQSQNVYSTSVKQYFANCIAWFVFFTRRSVGRMLLFFSSVGNLASDGSSVRLCIGATNRAIPKERHTNTDSQIGYVASLVLNLWDKATI